MARITVNDCLHRVPNRFELALLAAQRVRQLAAGDAPRIPPSDDSRTVLALREIAAGAVDPEELREIRIRWLQRMPPEEEIDGTATQDDAFAECFGRAEPPASGQAAVQKPQHSDVA